MIKDKRLNGKVVGEKYSVIMPLGATGDSNGYITNTPSIIFDGNKYKMWYSGYDDKRWRIRYVISKDGITWDKNGIIELLDINGESVNMQTHSPSVIYDGKKYRMWYSGYDGNTYKIHHATSEDGITWTKYDVDLSLGITCDDSVIYTNTPSVIFDDNKYKMWYTFYNGSKWSIRYTTSYDGITWVKSNIVVPLVVENNNKDIDIPFLLYDDSTCNMWYNGRDTNN